MQHRQQPRKPSEPSKQANIVLLQAISKHKTTHRHLGALLAAVRRTEPDVTQQEVADAFERYRTRQAMMKLGLDFPPHLQEPQPITAKHVGRWERNERAPKFHQLLSLYLAMTAGCGIEITLDERDEFLE